VVDIHPPPYNVVVLDLCGLFRGEVSLGYYHDADFLIEHQATQSVPFVVWVGYRVFLATVYINRTYVQMSASFPAYRQIILLLVFSFFTEKSGSMLIVPWNAGVSTGSAVCRKTCSDKVLAPVGVAWDWAWCWLGTG
jgi:hypothetical protein